MPDKLKLLAETHRFLFFDDQGRVAIVKRLDHTQWVLVGLLWAVLLRGIIKSKSADRNDMLNTLGDRAFRTAPAPKTTRHV